MHPPEIRQAALALVAAGHNDCEVSRRTGVPRRTIADWRRCRTDRVPELCPRCWRCTRPVRLSADSYAELLGLYLGDGCISPLARTFRLRLMLDARYPKIIDETADLLRLGFPKNKVGAFGHRTSMVTLSVYSSHLPCLFPQHGPGKKHQREIALESWQEEIVRRAPWPFIRGCIRTDGCSFLNRTGRYEYLCFDFANRSADIAELFVATCDRVGLQTRLTREVPRDTWRVRINRRSSVALMEAHVGVKS